MSCTRRAWWRETAFLDFHLFLHYQQPTNMASPGPSQRPRQASENGETQDASQSQLETETQARTQDGMRRKRPRGSLRQELFEKPDQDVQARLVAGYRDMQIAADGQLLGTGL